MERIRIIAEIGINHDGLFDRAVELVEAAAKAAVHAVKFQYRNLENAYASGSKQEIGDEILHREIHKNYLSPEELVDLAQRAQMLGMEAGISFFDVGDIADFAEEISHFQFFKIPSAELMNAGLIDRLIGMDRHLYLSTGCHTEHEIEDALGRLPPDGWTPMHCISNYPVSLQNARLGYLRHLKSRWRRDIGYSSHDDHWEVCLLAMQMGANVIERHITLDRQASGLDHSSSSTPDEFATMSAFAAELDLVMAGDGPRVPNQGELLNRQNLGRSYFAARALPRGHELMAEDIVYRSPNIGLNRTDIDAYMGRPLQQDVPPGESVVRSMFTPSENLPDNVIAFARKAGLALPVRLHDQQAIQQQFPIGAFEFHLSFREVLSEIDTDRFDPNNRYSIHLPDYVNSTQLMDPFSPHEKQREASMHILERTVELAERLQGMTGMTVPVVGSFSTVHGSKEGFFVQHAQLLQGYRSRDVLVIPQWLPPIAWYFGGSIRLHAMNEVRDAELLREHELGVCLDVCHMIMGRNCYGFSADALMDELGGLVRHVHIADAAGIDGEGLAIGEGEPENLPLIGRALGFDCLKVIEVWQGHLDQGAGFRKALLKLTELYDDGN